MDTTANRSSTNAAARQIAHGVAGGRRHMLAPGGVLIYDDTVADLLTGWRSAVPADFLW
jgi:hypothetical protein